MLYNISVKIKIYGGCPMYTTYKEYLKQETSLPFEEAMQIWNQIAEQGEADAACRELIDRFLKCAVDYVRIRNGWNQKSLAEKGQADAERTCCHNLVISAKNKLSVYMYEHKLGNDWDDWLGEERKRIGDFACYVVLLQGLEAR